MLSTPAKLIWPSQARAAPQVAAHGAGFIVKVQCRDLPVQSVPDGRSNHIWCACLGPQILGTLLILRTNWYTVRTVSNSHRSPYMYSKISILRPQPQNGYAYHRGRTDCSTCSRFLFINSLQYFLFSSLWGLSRLHHHHRDWRGKKGRCKGTDGVMIKVHFQYSCGDPCSIFSSCSR